MKNINKHYSILNSSQILYLLLLFTTFSFNIAFSNNHLDFTNFLDLELKKHNNSCSSWTDSFVIPSAFSVFSVYVTSNQFDPQVKISQNGKTLAENDDFENKRDAAIAISTSKNGSREYRVTVKGYECKASGKFRIYFSKKENGSNTWEHPKIYRTSFGGSAGKGQSCCSYTAYTFDPPETIHLTGLPYNTIVNGELSFNENENCWMYTHHTIDNAIYRNFEVVSYDFDPYLVIKDPQGQSLVSDDNSGKGDSAALPGYITVNKDNPYYLTIRSKNCRGTGTYSLYFYKELR